MRIRQQPRQTHGCDGMPGGMELYRLPAHEMLSRLERRDISSEELVQSHFDRIDAHESAVRAFVHQFREEALAQARVVDAARSRGEAMGAWAGMPITLKENLALIGRPQTLGIRPRAGRVATEDAAIVRAVKDTGAIVLGTTNVPQLLLAMESANALYGTTYNPWHLGRVPGGSSGGEGAAIASGMSPWGIGTDIGGSIRIPCAWCGLAGLKPTWGRWSSRGSAGGQPGQEAIKAVAGPMARTVDDVILMMQTLSSERQHLIDPGIAPVPLVDPGSVDVSGLRIGVFETDGLVQPAASVVRAVREAAAALTAAGATVVPYSPPAAWEMFDTYFGLLSADGFDTAVSVLEGDEWQQALQTVGRVNRMPSAMRNLIASGLDVAGEQRVARLLKVAGAKKVARVWQLVVERERLRRLELEAWREQELDLLIGPPTVTPAALPGTTHDWSIGGWYTMRFNLLDLPAGVVPVTRVRADEQDRSERKDRIDRRAADNEAGSVGLPVAAQVVGKPWQEHLVLAAMKAIEAHRSRPVPCPVDPVPAGLTADHTPECKGETHG